jgi:hypothetical protein
VLRSRTAAIPGVTRSGNRVRDWLSHIEMRPWLAQSGARRRIDPVDLTLTVHPHGSGARGEALRSGRMVSLAS